MARKERPIYIFYFLCICCFMIFISNPSWGAVDGVYGKPCGVAPRLYPQGVVQPGDENRVLRRGNSSVIMTLDFQKMDGISAANIGEDLGEGLMSLRGPDGAIVYGSADECWVSDDGLVYTFHIRENAKWSNGDPVTAIDFVNAVYRILDPSTNAGYAFFFYGVRNAEKINQGAVGQYDLSLLGVKALSPKWIQFHLAYPVPYFLNILALPPSFPINPRNLLLADSSDPKLASSFTQPNRFITNGPYMLSENVADDHITLVKNPRYWDRDHVRIGKVIYYPYADEREITSFLSGELDLTFEVASNLYEMLQHQDVENNKTELITLPYLGVYYYIFNFRFKLHNKKPVSLNDPNYEKPDNFSPFAMGDISDKQSPGYMLRKALTMAVDREALHKSLGDVYFPLYSDIIPRTRGVGDLQYSWSSWSKKQREDEARALFKKALAIFRQKGYLGPHDPLTLSIRYSDNVSYETVSDAVATMWSGIFGPDLKIDLIKRSWKDIMTDSHQGNFSILGEGWVGDYNYADTFLQLFLGDGAMNVGHYNNSTYDLLFSKAIKSPDVQERYNIMTSALNILLQDYPVIPLYQDGTAHMIKCNLKGYLPMDYKGVTSEKLGNNLLDLVRSADLWFDDPAHSARCQKYISDVAH